MTRRPAVTLIEVLVSMFIMAIGMLALLVLFPLGAVSMGQALKDDRCQSTSSMADNVAIAWNIRHGTFVASVLPINPVANPPVTLAAAGGTVYVDPYPSANGAVLPVVGTPAVIPNTALIPRMSPIFLQNLYQQVNPPPPQVPVVSVAQLVDRFFSLPDDITFLDNGAPDIVNTGGMIDRGRRYSFAYLVTAPQPQSALDSIVQLTVVVYSSRPIGALTSEATYTATNYITPPVFSPNGVQVSWNPAAQTTPNIKFGSWILDTTAGNTPSFYRVVNITDVGPGSLMVEVQPNLRANIGTAVLPGSITVMENVAEVFDKGTSWQP
jgi:hypothetical protein